MRAAGIKSMQAVKQKTVRRNSVFIRPDTLQQTEDVEHISREKRQLRNYWSTVDAAIYSITGHGGQQGLKRNMRRSTQGRTGSSEKTALQSKGALKAHRLFNPMGKWKIVWDIFIGALIMYSVVIIPYRIGFEQVAGPGAEAFDTCIDILFAVDIIATFNTAVDDPQTDLLVVNRGDIALKYLSFWFWIDTVSTIPFDKLIALFVSGSGALSSIRLIRVLRLMRLIKLMRVAKLGRLGNRFESFDINPAIFGVQKMIIQIWFVAHLLCCFWHFMATGPGQTTTTSKTVNWLDVFGYDVQPVSSRYSAAFYYVITSMLAIGYGDIHATNTSEMIYAMMIMIVGSILFGAVIAQVNRLIESRNPSMKAFKYRMNELRAYLNEKNLPNVLRTKTTVAYRYYLRKKSAFDENDILNDLPTSLLSSLVLTGYAEYINHIKMFKDLKRVFIVKLIVGFRPFQATVGEYVLKQNDVAEEVIFIMKGLVQFSTSSDGRETAVTGYSTDGGMFGDFEYYRKTNRFLNYIAMASCNLVSVTCKHFDEAMLAYPDAGTIVLHQLKARYKNFLMAKGSVSYQRSTGVRVKALLWVDGSIKSGVSEQEEGNELHSSYMRSNSPGGKHLRILLIDEDGNEEHMDEKIRNIFPIYYVVPPTLDTKIKWDLAIGVIIVYSIIVIPVQVGFNSSSSDEIFWFEKTLDFMFFVDMVISFRTGYNDDVTDALVVIPNKIYKNYLKTWFVIDFFSTMPFDLIFGAFLNTPSNSLKSIKLLKVSRLLRLLKLARFAKLRKYIAKVEDSLGISPVAFELGKMIVEVIFISHLTACFYWYVCTNMSSSTWYDLLGLRHADLESQYITTLYWTITTLATVGYGDITPSNKDEQGVTIVIMLLGATVFGYIVSNVSALMGSFDLTAQRLSEKISEVEGYLSEKNVPDSLGVGVVKQIKHTFSQMSAFDESSILNRLPTHLSRQIVSLKHEEALENIAILKYISNKGIVLHVFSMMSPAFYDTNEPLLTQGSIGTDIVFITRGKAQITRVTRTVRQLNIEQPPNKVKLKNLLMKHGGISAVTGNSISDGSSSVAKIVRLAREANKTSSLAGTMSPKPPPASRAPMLRDIPAVSESREDADSPRISAEEEEPTFVKSFNAASKKNDPPPRSPSKDSETAGPSDMPDLGSGSAPPMLRSKFSSLQRISSVRQPAKLLQRSKFARMETITTHTPICKVGPGHFCGHVSLMTRQKVKASVIAVLPCSVFLLSELDITMIVRDMPAVALILKRAFAHAILAQRNFAKEKIQHQRGVFMKKMRADFDALTLQKKSTLQARVRMRYKKLNTAIMIRRMTSTPEENVKAAPKFGLSNVVAQAQKPPIGIQKPSSNTQQSIDSEASGSYSFMSAVAAARDKGDPEGTPSVPKPFVRGGSVPKNGMKPRSGSIQPGSMSTRGRTGRRRVAVSGTRNHGFSAKVIKSLSSKLGSASVVGGGKVDLHNSGDIFYNSDDEDELDDMSYIKRTMPKKRSLSCQILGDSSVPFKLVHIERRQRRMSFPSHDLKVWKEDRILNMMV